MWIIQTFLFCYVSSEYTLKESRKPIYDFVKSSYLACFGVYLRDQDKSEAPHFLAKKCVGYFRQWTIGNRNWLTFGVPMVGRKPRNIITMPPINCLVRSRERYTTFWWNTYLPTLPKANIESSMPDEIRCKIRQWFWSRFRKFPTIRSRTIERFY